MAGSLAVIGRDVQPPTICARCGADEMGCQVKLGLGGRRCCDQCGHADVRRRGGDGVDQRDAEDPVDHDDVHHGLDGEDHHDLHREDHGLDDVDHHVGDGVDRDDLHEAAS